MNPPTNSNASAPVGSVALKSLRRCKRPVTSLLLGCFSLWTVQVKGASFYWDSDGTAAGNNATTGAGLGGSGSWDNASNVWWNGVATDGAWVNGTNTGIFSGSAGLVTLSGPITAGGLMFNTTGYEITGDTLTLAAPIGAVSPNIAVNGLGNRATISSKLAGTSGFIKSGNGSLVLTNPANSFSGDIAIRQGSLVITDADQLGNGTTAISITGVPNTGNPGFSGGQLVVNGIGGGITIDRDISASGRGPNAANAAGAVLSIGYNDFAGGLTLGAGVGEGRATSAYGISTISGGLDLGTGGGAVMYGNGNWVISGIVNASESANDRFVKAQALLATTLWLQNAANNFTDSIRLDSGTVRVSDNGALGLNAGTQALDFNGGRLEVRSDVPNFGSRNVNIRGNTSQIFVDRGIGGSGLNQLFNFGNLNNSAANGGLTAEGRDGNSLTITGPLSNGTQGAGTLGNRVISWINGGTLGFTNSGNGTYTIDASVIRLSETTARTMTVTATGETVLTGNILQAGTGAVSLVKSGVGLFTIQGTASTASGSTQISQGTLSIPNLASIPTAGGLLIGNATTTGGTLSYTGGTATLANPITINTTTGNAYLNANGSGPLTLTGPITNGVGVGGAHTIVLGGTNSADNTITSSISAGIAGATSIQKIGVGTWNLAPTSSNLFTGTTTVSGGTLKLTDGAAIDLLPDAGAVIFGVDTFTQAAGGTLSYIGGANSETVGALTATAGHGVVSASSGVLTFASMGVRTAGASIDVLNTGTVNVTGTSAFINGGTYFNGADFAYSGAGTTVRAPVYGTDAGFVTAGAALTAASHNLVSGGTSTGALTVSSLKISGSQTVTQTGLLTINAGANTPGGILQTGGSGTITGTGVTTGGSGDLVIRVNGTGDTLTLSAPISATTTGGVTKSGPGTLILNAVNAETTGGAFSINEGTVQLLGATTTLGAASMNLNIRQGATLDVNGINVSSTPLSGTATNNLNALNGAGMITNSAASGTATITIGSANTSGYFTGTILDGATAALRIIKAGTGTQSLTGVNTFSGLQINAGTVAFALPAGTTTWNAGANSPVGPGTSAGSLIFNGGTLQYTGSGAIFSETQTPSITTDREFTLAGNGTIDSSGRFGNNVLASGGANNAALVWTNTNDLTFSGSATARTLTLTGDSTGDNELRAHLVNNGAGALSFTKAGAGLWLLNPSSSNVHSGATTVTGGALQVLPSTAAVQGLSANSNLVLNGGVIQTAGSFTQTLGTGAGQVQLPFGFSGFSSSGVGATPKLTVTLGGGPITWGSSTFNPATLLLSNVSALADVEFTNDLIISQGVAATPTVSTTNASATITITTGSTAGLEIGQAISGANIPAGATITNITSATQFTISANATATATLTAATITAGGYRQIQVDDNGFTGLDFATVSGEISGPGAIRKSGGGTLILGNANTYTGDTQLTAGATVVTSIGAAGASATSVGANVGGGNLQLGNGGTSVGSLLYVGSGETTTRLIQINSTTGSPTIDATGSGALVLQSISNNLAGAKTLNIRGNNVDGNMITSQLTDNGGALTLTKSDSGVWILNPSVANTFTGNINASGGMLGLTSNAIGSSPNLVISNAAIFAHGGDLTTSVPVILANNSAAVFAGPNNITLNGSVTKQAGANDQTFSNNLENGAVLTVNGNFINAQNAAATRNINVRGYGSTIWNGIIQDNSATALTRFDIRLADSASFTLGGPNTLTGGILLGQGTLIVGNVTGFGPAANSIILDGGELQSTVALTGANKVTNKIILAGDQVRIGGSSSIDFNGVFENNAGNRLLRNELTGGATLTLSGTVNLSNDATGRTLTIRGASDTLISGTVANGGAGAGGLAYSGLGTLTLTGTNTATGALTVNRNDIKLSSSGNWAGSVVLNPIGTLTLDNSGGSVNRLADAGAFTGQGGTLSIIGAAGGTAEATGALTLNSVQTYINTSGGNVDLTFASVAFANSGSSLNLSGVSSLGVNNKVKFTAAPSGAAIVFGPVGVIPRIYLGGSDFAKYDSSNGVVPLVSGDYNLGNNLNTAAATDTMNLTASSSLTAFRTVNAVKLNGTGVSVGGGNTQRLTVTSGGIINTVGNNSIDVPLSFTNTPILQIANGTTLTVNNSFMGATNFIKALPGTLVMNAPSFVTGTHNLLNGTTKLISGGLNTFFPGQLLNINNGATLDLNGGVQYVGQLSDPGILPEAGGLVTSTSGPALLVTNMNAAGTTFATNINDGGLGNVVTLARVGGNTLTLESANTYSGATVMMGGVLQLQDDATILNTSSIDLNAAQLTLNNNASLQRAIYDRVSDTTPISLRDGTILFTGKVSDPSYEVFGALTSAQGSNAVTVNWGGTGTAGAFASADVTFASLARNAGTTVNFSGTNLGQQGNNARIVFSSPLSSVSGGALGAWAIANSTDYAAYNTGNGVGVVGTGGFVDYSAGFGAGKITQLQAGTNSILTTQLPAGTTTTDLLQFAGNNFNNLTFAAGSDALNLAQGGILRSNNSFGTSIGTPTVRGNITSGTGELVVFDNASANPTFANAATTIGSPVVTGLNTSGLVVGMSVTNANFPAGTKVVSIDNSGQVTLSNNATATAATQTLTVAMDGGSTTNTSPVVTMASTVGISPGMTLTGTGIPANSYVVSVDSATQVTLSQNATATATGTITFTPGLTNVVINSVIKGGTSFVKSGAGVVALSAPNTYTGGTTVVQGTLNLVGAGSAGVGSYVVIPAGGVILGGANLTMLTNSGQIDPTNAVTLRRSSTMTLVGTNTLDRLVFENNGGTTNPTVNVGTVLNLTNATPVSVTNMNALTVPTITQGTLAFGAGAKTISVEGPTIGGQLYSAINPALNIASIITGTGTVTKTGTGLLQLSGQNTFPSFVVSSGGIVIGAGTTTSAGTVISGPLGIGQVSMASGTTLVSNSSQTIANPLSFAGTPLFDSTANTVWTNTFTGALTGAGVTGPAITVNVNNPFQTVALLGTFPGAFNSITKTGLGTLIFNATNYTGDFNATALGNPNAVTLIHDGDGTGSQQTIAMGNVIFDSGIVPNITINRGGSLPFGLAVNKILAPASVSNLGLGLTVSVNAGYGLQVSNAISFTGTPTYNVNGTQASNITQGLYLTGDLTGTGFNKTGSGTMVINNATPANNTFAGNINITQGTLSVAADGQLNGNMIVLNPSTGTSAFRATGTFATSEVIQLANTANTRAIEVSNGNTLTLNSAFDLNAGAGATASLNKQDLGTLVVDVNNPSWSGQINITEGTILLNNPALTTPLGTGTIVASPAAVFGSALQLAGGVTVSNPLTLQATANFLNGGINFQGTLDSVSGINTYSGPIAMPFDATIGARAGSTLNLTGLITATGTHRLQFNAEGDINASGGETGTLFGFDKYGAGTLNITTALFGGTITTGGIKVEGGTLRLSGAGTTNSSGAVNIVYGGAEMQLDNSGTNTNNRLTARALTLQGGTFNFIANNSTELAGAFIADQGANTIINGGSGTSALTFATFAGSAGGTLNVTGTFGTATNFLKFTTAPTLTPATTGILNRVTVNGNELATYGANGVVPFTAYSPATNILSATATQTFKATGATINSLGGPQTLNALTINNTAAVGGLGGNPPTTLTLTSGTILANGTGGAFLNVPIVAFAGVEGIIHVQSGQSLTVNSGMSGTGGLSKDLPGTLNINAQQFVSGTTYVNGGTLKLTSSGVTNPLLYNQGLAVNVGGTLDLNGQNQFVAGLSSASAGGSTGIGGGMVTNTGAGQSILTINGNTNFAGVISGDIYLNKTGTGALNLQNAQTYSGATLLTGGTTTLNDRGALPNTSSIAINYAGLSLANGNLYAVSNRVNDFASITMKGGTISFAGRQQWNSSETLGALTISEGLNYINHTNGGTNVNSSVLTFALLNRTGSATLRFNGNSNSLGAIGSTPNTFFTTAPTLTNNILGPWAIVDREWASYDSTFGVGQLNQNGFAGYSGTPLTGSPTATDNVRFGNAGTTVLAANTTVGTLAFASQAAATVLDLGGNTLTAQGGGILFSQATDNVDFSIINGSIKGPSGGGDLYLTHANYAGTNRTVTYGAPIVDNGGATRVVFTSGQIEAAGVGNSNLNAVNTNTGGSVFNSGNYVLGATGALGTGGLTVNQAILTQLAGGVIPSTNALTMGGSSLVNLVGSNSLAGITFNNLGGAAPTVNPTGTLTLTGGVTVSTVNAGNPAVIGTGTIDLNGVGSFAMNVGAAVINGVDVAPWQSALTITSLIQNGGIAKSGAGMLQLSNAASTFAGGINVTTGGLIIGASSFGPNLGDPLTSGPLGIGAVTMAANTTLVSTGAFSVTNDFTFLGDTVFNGINNLTLNGNTTLPTLWNAQVTAPQMTVTIGNVVGSLPTDVTNKTGLGTLVLGNYAGTLNIGGGLALIGDGNTLGTIESVSLGSAINITTDTSITVNRSGGAPNARNKTIQEASFTDNGSLVSITNLSGYGLEITGGTTFTGASTLGVVNATASNVVQGLTLSGVVSDSGGYTLVKSGLGTLALTNSGNTFGGVGATIDVLNGILSASSDGALGNSANTITLEVDGTTGTGFRATGSFSTARTFNLSALNNAFEVTQGNTLTLTTPFNLSALSNTLNKNDSGVFAINANNSTMTGAVTINGGAILMQNGSALGSGTITVNNPIGSALQLSGGITVANPITLTANSQAGGINGGGTIESVLGVNTYNGLITQTAGNAATYGADAGATLNINGNIATANTSSFWAGTGGIINLNSILGNGGAGGALLKIGPGALNVTVNQPAYTGAVTVNAGTLKVSGSGTKLGTTGAVTVTSTGTLVLDDTGTATANRLGGRALTLQGGTFSYIGNSGTSAESVGNLTISRPGGTFIANNGGGTSAITFASLGGTANAVGGDASLSFQSVGAALGSASNKILFTTAPTLTNSLLQRATLNGSDFVTYGANGIAPFASYNAGSTTNINSVTATTGTADVNAVMTTRNLTASKTLNAIRISTSGANIGATGAAVVAGGNTPAVLTLASGAVLATGGGTQTISVPVLATSINTGTTTIQDFFAVDTSTTLEISSVLTGNAGWVKSGAGTLILTPALSPINNRTGNTLTGNGNINSGTVVLNGGNNTLSANQFMNVASGATLDLNGNSQLVRTLFTDTSYEGGGGIVTSSLASATLVSNADNTARSWSGQLTGALSYMRTGDNTLSFYSDNSYSGHTIIAGGTTTLLDGARLSGTSDIDIVYATLNLTNSGTKDLADRVNDTAPISLRGGTINYTGRAQTASTETLGDVTLNRGFSFITSTAGGTGVNSADLMLASLTQNPGSYATVNFNSTNLGQAGSFGRIEIGTINGVATTPTTVGLGLSNNMIGAWALVQNDFATYIPGLGVAALGANGALQYDLVNTFTGGVATDNVRLTATTTIPGGGKTVNAVSMSGSNIALNFTAGTDVLNVVSGGLIGPNNNQTIGTTAIRGVLTAGGTSAGTNPLYLYNRANTLTVNSQIVDNGVGTTKLVLNASGGTIALGNGTSTYTGGTIVNGGTVTLVPTVGSIVIPAATIPADGLVINGATVTATAAGQIAPANIVTINGSSILNLIGDNTLAGLIFRDDGGGSTGSTVNSNFGVLTLNGNVTSTTANPGSTSTIVGRVDFGSVMRTLDISPTTFNGQELAALLSDFNLQGVVGTTGGIKKTGDGVLQFNGVDIYTGPTQVDAGRIQPGTINGGSRFSTLTLNGTTTALNLNNVSTIWGGLSGTGFVTNSGTTAQTLTVGYNGADTTFSGNFYRFNDAVANAVALAKIGSGTLTFDSSGAASNTTGALTVNRGAVRFADLGTSSFEIATLVVNEGGTLILDNSNATSSANVNNRLAGGPLNLSGGTFNVLGRDGTATTDLAGVLTFGASASSINLTAGASGTVVETFASLSQSAGSTAIISGTDLGTTTKLMFTTAPTLTPASTGILPRVAVGTDFATYDAVKGVIPFTAYTTVTDVNLAAATNTIKVDATTTVRDLTLPRTLNAVNIVDNSVTLGSSGLLLPTQGWTVTSGGILVNGNTAAITAPVLALGAEGVLRVNGSALSIGSSITGTAGLTKTGVGALTLTSPQSYTGLTALNLGNMTLAGGNNTLLVTPTGTIPGVADLQVNGGVLDLNGNNQAVRNFLNSNTLGFIAGEITNSSATAVTLTTAMSANSTFGATISGNLTLVRSGNNTLILPDANTYTGATIVRGGGLTLQDQGSLATSGITLNFGALTLNNANLNPLAALNPVRFAATTPLTMQGGTWVITPGGSVDNTTTVNNVTILAGGANTITPNGVTGGTNTINIGNLVLPANGGTTLHFNTDPSQPSTGGAQVFLGQLNGVAPVSNSFLGSNVVINNGEYGVYNSAQGVVRYGSTALSGNTIPAYAAALASGNNLPTNVSSTGADVAISANTTIGALRMTGGATRAITFTAGTEVLNLALGGLLRSNEAFALNVGTTALRGVLTSGGTATTGTTDLVTWHNQNTITINSVIADNGLGNKTRLVKSGPAGLTLTAANTYTGGTVVDQGTLTINATAGAGTVVIPGDLTLNNANLTESTNGGQIAATSNVVLNGSSVLTLAGTSNTLNSVTFNNTGGNATPTVATGTLLILSSATPITVTNDNFSFTPTISGTELNLVDGAAISTSGLSADALIISAKITTAASTTPLIKTGTGSLVLSSTTSAFANGFNLDQGSLIFAASSTPTSGVVTAGPIGTGALSLANGVAVMSDSTVRTIANLVNVAGDFTFGSPSTMDARANAGNGLIFSNTVTLAAGAHNITVNGLLTTGTITGKLTGGTGVSKDGLGTLVLSSTGNDYGGSTGVTAGTLQLGVGGAIPDTSALVVGAGGFFNVNGFAETVGSLSGAGVITNTGAVQTLTVGGDNTNTAFTGSITNQANALSITKIGTGTQTLSGTNSYTGTTTINGGILNVGSAETVGVSGPLGASVANAPGSIVFGGGTLQYSAANQNDYSGRFSTAASQPISIDTNGQNVTFATALTSTGGTLAKTGTGVLTLTAAETYSGTTTVSGGTLQVADGTTGALNGTGSVTVVKAGSTILNAPVLSGGSGGNAGVGVVAGSTIIGDTGDNTARGVIAPGITANTTTSNQTMTFTNAGGLTVAGGSQMQLSITTPTVAQDATLIAAMGSVGYTNAYDYITLNNPTWTTGAPATVNDYDFIDLTTGALTLGTRNGGFGSGTVAILDNGYLTGAAQGDVFNLLDWVGSLGGLFATTGSSTGGVDGDLDLPTLSSGLAWDTTAFASHGVLVVVPEPGRLALLVFGLLGLCVRRRRREAV